MSREQPIAFVGMPGGGKSTVGRQLAKRIGWGFVDSDIEIERQLGQSIRSFFEAEGEEAFRDIESNVLKQLVGLPRTVIGTGGGIVLRPANRESLRSHSLVVYLRSTPEELHRRLRNDQTRPLLQVADPLHRLRELFEQRDPLYREVADFVIDPGRPSANSLVNMVLMQLELAGVLDPSRAGSPIDGVRG